MSELDYNAQIVEKDFGRTLVMMTEVSRDSFLHSFFMKVLEKAALLLAEQYVAKFGPEIFAQMDPQAIANLAVANSGAAIAGELKKEAATQTRVVEHVRRELYQRGVFGGIKRI